MLNINKRNKEVENLLKTSYNTTKILIYFSTKTAGADFDPYEKNYTYTNLNPKAIKAYVRDIKAEKLVWNQYGLAEAGAKEIICEEKYAEWMRLATKIEIDSDAYQVYKDNVGGKMLIEKRPFKLCRVILQRVK